MSKQFSPKKNNKKKVGKTSPLYGKFINNNKQQNENSNYKMIIMIWELKKKKRHFYLLF
jgi:hypothetical protein